MTRFPFLARHIAKAAIAAWWNAWLGLWSFVWEQSDPDAKRDARAQERDGLDADLLDRGFHGGYAAGSGGDW